MWIELIINIKIAKCIFWNPKWRTNMRFYFKYEGQETELIYSFIIYLP